MAKRKKISAEEVAAMRARSAEVGRKLAERIEYHKAKLEEERRHGLR
jgi:hypothetical protein